MRPPVPLRDEIVEASSANLLLRPDAITGLGSLPMKILIVDDHPLVRDAVARILREREDTTVLEAADAARADACIDENEDLDLVVLDLRLPDRDGLELLADIRERRPAVSVVVLSASHDRKEIARALHLGALGFIPKSADRAVMVRAFELVFSGGVYVPPELVVPRYSAPERTTSAGDASLRAAIGLTERQLDVLALMMEGKSNKGICRALNIAEPTVKNHVTAILKALEVQNRTEAVIAARKLGLVRQGGGS